jgi:hypothetical protein
VFVFLALVIRRRSRQIMMLINMPNMTETKLSTTILQRMMKRKKRR